MRNTNFLKPSYDGHNFAAIPHSIGPLLGGPGRPALAAEFFRGLPQTYDAVVLFVVDGFGWRFFERYAGDYPALRRFADAGRAFKLTAQFPTTTAAHITCLHTGLTSGESGVYEWQYYEPQLDAVILPMLFSFAGTKESDQLKPTGIAPASLYPTQTIYPALARQGVAAQVFQPKEFTPSTYSDAMLVGAKAVGYRTLAEGLVNLRAALRQRTGPSYFVHYFGAIDTIAHEYGPESPQIEAEIDTFLTVLERLFLSRLDGQGRVLFLLTADHGEIQVDPQTTFYLNTDAELAPLLPLLRTDRRGNILPPGGGPRDAFLYVRDEALDEAHDLLGRRLAGRAVVRKTADLIAEGYFGPQPPSLEFLGRVGNLVILPFAGEAVWWYEKGRFEQKFYGHHGGLTPEEIEIPLLVGAF